jgi:hypothetical protein
MKDNVWAISDPPALRAPEPAAGSVVDLRSFTPRGASRLVSPTTSGSSPFGVRRPSSLVVSPALPADADRRGSSEEAMRNLPSDSEAARVDNQLAGAKRNTWSLPNRLLTVREAEDAVAPIEREDHAD